MADTTGSLRDDEVSGDGAAPSEVSKHNGGVLAIGVFKLLEALFFLLVAAGAIHFMHHDLGDAALRLANNLGINLEGHLWAWVDQHLDTVTSHRLKQIGAWTCFFSCLRVTEGIGLVLEKVWAEYLTIGVTISFLPWEMYEIVRRLDWFRVGLFVCNLIVLAYLLWWLQRNKRMLKG